jgi:hypothetical protein
MLMLSSLQKKKVAKLIATVSGFLKSCTQQTKEQAREQNPLYR